MPRLLSPTLHTVRAATALASARPAYAAGVRAAVATVGPLLLAHQLGIGGATWMSLGGFVVALADPGGSYRARAATMGSVALCTAVALALGTLASGHIAIAVPFTFGVALAASLARAWGAAGVSVGGAALTAFAIALAFPPTSSDGVLDRVAFGIVGGLWAMGLALVLWPLQPYRPARLAVARSYRALAAFTAQAALELRATLASETSELPAGSAAVRTALEDARFILTRSRGGRSGTSARGERLVVLGESVDQLFGHVVAVAESVDSIRAGARAAAVDDAVASALDQIARSAHQLAGAVAAERDGDGIAIHWSGDGVRAATDAHAVPGEEGALHYRQAAVILDRAAHYAGEAARTVSELDDAREPARPSLPSVAPEPDLLMSPLESLRDSLSVDSLLLRYAARVAVVATIAVALGELVAIKRGYWMTITVIVILQPYTGATTQRALQRVAGTILGALLTAALGAMFHDPRAILVLAFIFAASCVALLPVNYAAFSVFLTPTFVLLAEASAGDWHLASTRVVNTLLGGALALAGSYLLWPSPEASRLPGYLALALRANREYLARVMELFDDTSADAGRMLREARRRVGLATMNADESFQRLLGESRGESTGLGDAMAYLTCSRRLTASIAALALTRHADSGVSGTSLQPFADTAARVLDDLAAAVAGSRAPAALPAEVASETAPGREAAIPPLVRARLDRLARQIWLLHDIIGRWTATGGERSGR